MTDREKVLQALEHCDLCSDMPNCPGCAYLREPDCMEHLKRDIIALLKGQEPRVMTLEDVIGGAGTPAYMEARSQRGYRGWALIYDVQEGMGITGKRVGLTQPGHITIWPAVELYGVKWRCWTGEPTEEQREAEPWMWWICSG